jgi:hypothetical protein
LEGFHSPDICNTSVGACKFLLENPLKKTESETEGKFKIASWLKRFQRQEGNGSASGTFCLRTHLYVALNLRMSEATHSIRLHGVDRDEFIFHFNVSKINTVARVSL